MYNDNYLVPEYDNDVDYRIFLLKLFGLETFNIDEINKIIHDLYLKCKTDTQTAALMREANNISNDDEIGLMILHSYDYLYLFNRYLSSSNDRTDLYDNLLNKLKK